MLGGIFHCYSNFSRKLCKQTVETLIRHRVRLGHLIWAGLFAYVQEKGQYAYMGQNAFSLLISLELQKFGKYIVEVIFLVKVH